MGTVIETVSSFNDLSPGALDPDNPAGNYIAIKHVSFDIVIILAHLRENSLLVKQGDTIKEGQPIAKVGNSGNTTEPHLHIHCVTNTTHDFLFKGQGVPMIFESKFLVRNDLVIQKK